MLKQGEGRAWPSREGFPKWVLSDSVNSHQIWTGMGSHEKSSKERAEKTASAVGRNKTSGWQGLGVRVATGTHIGLTTGCIFLPTAQTLGDGEKYTWGQAFALAVKTPASFVSVLGGL